MNLAYRHLLPENFSPQSRVWIYQASRLLSMGEALQAEEMINGFIAGWHSHGTPVKGAGYLFFGQFVILMADETATGVSGCSTDSSVYLVREIEKRFGISMFDRLSLAFIVKDKIQLLPLSQLSYAFDNGFLTAATLYFNNTVATKQELEKNWIIPVQDSWLASRIPAGTGKD